MALSGGVLTYLSVVTVDANYLRMSEMGDLSNIDSVSLTVVVNQCTQLEHFVYNGNVLDGLELQAVLRANPHLSRLDLVGTLRGKSVVPFEGVLCPNLATITARLELKEQFGAFILPLLLSLLRPNKQVHTLVLDSQLSLVIRDMIVVEQSDVLGVLKHCPNLTTLSLQRSQIDTQTVHTITTLCPHLQHVDISCTESVDDLAVRHLAQNLRLRSLFVDSTNMSHEFLTHLVEFSSSTLQTLSCSTVNRYRQPVMFKAALKVLLSTCDSLRALTIDSVHLCEDFEQNLSQLTIFGTLIDNKTFEFVENHCESLKRLCVIDFMPESPVDEEHIRQLVDTCFNLHTVVVMDALYEKVTNVVRTHYLHRLPQIIVSNQLKDMHITVLDAAA